MTICNCTQNRIQPENLEQLFNMENNTTENMSCHSCCCIIFNIEENHVLVMHRLGKFDKLLRPGVGLVCFNCFTQGIAKNMSLMLRTLNVLVSTKTKDHTFMILGNFVVSTYTIAVF